MKKTLFAIALSSFAVATTANAGWYAEGDLGVSRLKFTSYSGLNKTKLTPSIAGGYDFGDWRLALDYTHYGKSSSNVHNDAVSAKVSGIGFSAIYDINLNSAIEPYIGARVAQNLFKIERTSANAFHSHTENKLGYGVVAGAQYKLDNNWAVNGGIEYNRLGNYEDTKVNQYGAKVGIRYNF